jgi:hypothetical protein
MSNSKNKFTKLNINNEFKGKSAEIQAKTTIRPNQTGLQTLGKAVSARRMPKPANLPSLRSENAIISTTTTTTQSSSSTATTITSSSSSRLLLNNQSQLTSSIINQNNNNNQSNEQTWNDNHQNDEQQHNSSITRQTWSTTNYTNSNSNSLDVNHFF